MSKKYHPLGAHLTKNLRRAPLFGGTLTAYNFGQNGQNAKNFGPIIKPAKSRFWGNFFWGDFDLFCLRSGPNREPTPKSALKYGTFAPFFGTLNFEPP